MGATMLDVKVAIDDRRRRLALEPFLRALDASSDATDVRAFVPHLYFYVFGFQDMLRIAHERVVDPQLREISGRHREEDAGHEQWFAHDLAELDCIRDVVWLFSEEHRPTRDISYALIAEILGATDDRVRIVFPLILEAVGSTFFPRVVALLERAGFRGRLRYFSRSHQDVEASHDVFTAEGERLLNEISFEASAYDEAITMVHRCFDLLEQLAAHLEAQRLQARR